MGNWLTRDKQYFGGFWLPFILVFVGIIMLLNYLTFSLERITPVSGKIVRVMEWEHTIFYLENSKQKYVVWRKGDNQSNVEKIKEGVYVTVWAKPGKEQVYQLMVEDSIVIPYQRSKLIFYVSLSMVIIGIILIPIVLRDRKNNPELFKRR